MNSIYLSAMDSPRLSASPAVKAGYLCPNMAFNRTAGYVPSFSASGGAGRRLT
jgi:hypothetical protein